MKAAAGLLALVILASPVVSQAQSRNCTRIGNQVLCDNGDSATQIGNQTYYNYGNQDRARERGLPNSAVQIGNQRLYDNGESATDIGNSRFFSNGETRQRIGNTDFYSNGRTCTRIGQFTSCD